MRITFPTSVIVLGGGAIALELASFYAGVGSRVTVIQRSAQVLKEMDADVAEALTEALEQRGIEIFRGTESARVPSASDDRKRVDFTHAGAERAVEAEEILYALGREANARVARARARRRDDRARPASPPTRSQQCEPAHIFAAGDVCGPHEVVHIAIQQGELAARNAARGLGRLDGELEDDGLRAQACSPFSRIREVAAVGPHRTRGAKLGTRLSDREVSLRRPRQSRWCAARRDGFVKLHRGRATRGASSARRASARKRRN